MDAMASMPSDCALPDNMGGGGGSGGGGRGVCLLLLQLVLQPWALNLCKSADCKALKGWLPHTCCATSLCLSGTSAFASYQGAVTFMQAAVAKALASGDARTAAWVRCRWQQLKHLSHTSGRAARCIVSGLADTLSLLPWHTMQETSTAAAQLYAQFYSSGSKLGPP